MDKDIHNSKQALLDFLDIRENFLYPDFSGKYHEKELLKKNGKTRLIKPPNQNLKKVQRQILDKVLSKFKQLESAFGLSKDKNIVSNAKAHQGNHLNQLLTLDLENFFPNVTRRQILTTFKKLKFNHENSLILTKICTVDGSLPQGSPTSPYLASLSCVKLDKEIYTFCKRRHLVYTRYFDDISISGKNINAKIIKDIQNIVQKCKFIINNEKTKHYKEDDLKIINGIVIRKNNLSVQESYKKEIEEYYARFKSDKSKQSENAFKGKFGFFVYLDKKEALQFLDQIKKIM